MLKNNHLYNDKSLLIPANLNFGEWMLRRFISFKNSVAILNPKTGKGFTYQALAQQSVDIALSLSRFGVKKGDTVAFLSDKMEQCSALMFGSIFCGAAFTQIIPKGEALIKLRIQLSKPTVIFCFVESYFKYEQIIRTAGCSRFVVYGEAKSPAISFRNFLTETTCIDDFQVTPVEGFKDIAWIQYSSGTTGLPKTIPLTHLNMCAGVASSHQLHKYLERKVVLNSDLLLMNCLYAGAKLLIIRSEAELEDAKKHKVQVIFAVPYDYAVLMKTDATEFDYNSVEFLFSAATPIEQNFVTKMLERFSNAKEVYHVYGMTELSLISYAIMRSKGVKSYCVGRVVPGTTVKVVDLETNKPASANQHGEIRIKSPLLMSFGYRGLTPGSHLDEEGFFKTGDLGYYDEDKYLYVVDRIKDIIKYKGVTVATAEIEQILIQHPDVLEASVVGIPNEQDGEVPAAFVVLERNSKVDPQHIIDFVTTQVDEYSGLAGGLKIVEKLPRGNRNKVDKKLLRKMLIS